MHMQFCIGWIDYADSKCKNTKGAIPPSSTTTVILSLESLPLSWRYCEPKPSTVIWSTKSEKSRGKDCRSRTKAKWKPSVCKTCCGSNLQKKWSNGATFARKAGIEFAKWFQFKTIFTAVSTTRWTKQRGLGFDSN